MTGSRLYQELARKLAAEISSGLYPVGSRLPSERDLAARYAVSRPTVREAIIALEVNGMVEVRIGSGAHVMSSPASSDLACFNLSAIELSEARLLFEGEAAALAATQITDPEVARIEALVAAIARENNDSRSKERADRAFHLAIARATRNGAVLKTIARLWDLRETSPESALLHAKARVANVKPVVDEHSAIVDALRSRDPVAARAAMRTHLAAVIDSLQFAIEEEAAEEDRNAIRLRGERFRRATA